MITSKKTLLIIALSSTLAACGGGSSNATTQPNTDSDTVIDPTISKPKDQKVDINNTSVSDYNRYTLDGHEILLIPSAFQTGGALSLKGSNINGDTLDRKVSGSTFKNVRFGILFPEGKDLVAFSQGSISNDVPTSGTATYSGFAFKTKDDFAEQIDFTSVVNFGDKTINILNHVGTISGNSFTFDDGKGNGKFYGPQAAELGGAHSNDTAVTAFGAKKN